MAIVATARRPARLGWTVLPLYTATLFLSAFLLFYVLFAPVCKLCIIVFFPAFKLFM